MTYHNWSAPEAKTHKHPGGYTDLDNDPRDDGSDSGGWAAGARGITQVCKRSKPTKRERNLARRQRQHTNFPQSADGSQSANAGRAIAPGSHNIRKH